MPARLADGVTPVSPPVVKTQDFRARGPHDVSTSEGRVPTASGPGVAFTRFRPTNPRAAALVVLGHGFLRDRSRMAGLAEHLASWGLEVVTVDFRHSRPWAGHHDKNAQDMVALAHHLGARQVIYSGFSAGGLSALLAAAADPAAIGYLGLDMVDDGTGAMAAAGLRFPLHGLVAPPSACNAHGNGLKVFAASAKPSRVVQVADASHCHFEFPMDGRCWLICGKGGQRRSRADIQTSILSLATASLLWQTGADPSAKSVWLAGGALAID
jgi:hypothetical protein